jgi:hypothetical protein
VQLPDTGPWSWGLGALGTAGGIYLAYKQYCETPATADIAKCASLTEEPGNLGLVALGGVIGWLIGVGIDSSQGS